MHPSKEKRVLEKELEQEYLPCSRLLKNKKAFIMRVITFMDFKMTLEKVFGSGANTVLYQLGTSCGKRSCARMVKKYGEIDRTKLLKSLAIHKRNERWGTVKFNLDEEGKGRIRVYESFEAKQYGDSANPVCHFFRGYLAGALYTIFKREIKVTEITCIAQNHKFCEFEVR